MAPPKIHEDLAAIVLVGKFNPAIFQPTWLAAKGLIRQTESDAATIDVIHPEVAQFRVGPFQLVVTRDRFELRTTDVASHAPLRDLVVGVFDLLEQTPTALLGFNRSLHIDLVDDERWHKLGHLVAPKEPWKDIVDGAGLWSLAMKGPVAEPLHARTEVRVEPSFRFRHSAFIFVNAEYASPATSGTAEFVRIVREEWEGFMQSANARVMRLVGHVLEGAA